MDKHQNIKDIVTSTLSEQLGVEPSDIHEEDSFKEDLHMMPTDMTDFIETLSTKNLSTSEINFEEVETIGELIDYLSSKEEI